MKALTIRQPHVAAIFAGLKLWETRSWATKYRGPLAIHAAAKADGDAMDTLAFEYRLELKWPLPMGSIVGVVEVIDCVPTTPALRRQNAPWGDFSPGRYAWRLARPLALATPIPMRGQLSLWEVPTADAIAKLRALVKGR